MPVRVLHVFAPFFRQRFGGPIYNWQFYFSKWHNPEIAHYVIDTESGQLLAAQDAFDFEFKGDQKTASKWERLTWILRLYKNLRRYQSQYDLLHFHLVWWGSLLIAVWAKRRAIPTIYESVLLGSDTPAALRAEKLGKLKLKLLQKFTSILAISSGIAEEYLQHGFTTSQVHTQMNCIDTELFHPGSGLTEKQALRANFGLPPKSFILLFVGSLIERKGLDLLVSAFCQLANSNLTLYLWLVGPRTRAENPDLDERFLQVQLDKIKAAHLEGRVIISGLIQERQVLADAFRAADLFVFPSRKEGLPNVVLEAMACGAAVLVSDLPGLKNVLIAGQNSFLVPQEDVTGLVKSIQYLQENPRAIADVGIVAREYILSHHSFAAWQEHLTQYYQSLVTKI